MIIKKGQPYVPTGPTKNTPVKMPQIVDTDKIHRMVKAQKLSDVLAKLAMGKK